MKELKVIKIGGWVVENEQNLNAFLSHYSQIKGNKILVHGGGTWVSDMSGKLGIKVKKIEGRRITDAETLKVVMMMLAGVANKTIVAKLQAHGCNALGLTGADGDLIRYVKRPVKNKVDYGFVGDVERVDSLALEKLMKAGFSPVFTALTHDKEGQMLNTNADTIATVLAVSMAEQYNTELIFCFELPGVLKDVQDKGSVISEINSSTYQQLKSEQIISDGMLPKIDNAFEALRMGVRKVRICHSDDIVKFAEGKINFGTQISI